MPPEPATRDPLAADKRLNRPSVALNPFATLLFMEAAKQLNKRSSAKRARWATLTGHPFPKSADDHELPDPGTWTLPDAELG